MNNPFLQSVQSRLFYTGIWVIIMITQIFPTSYACDSALDISETLHYYYDSLIYNTLQAVCILALWYPAIHSRRKIKPNQRKKETGNSFYSGQSNFLYRSQWRLRVDSYSRNQIPERPHVDEKYLPDLVKHQTNSCQ